MLTVDAVEKSNHPEREIEPEAISPALRLPVFVVFTSVNPTLKALGKASQLAALLQTSIEVLVVQVVPYLLPLDEPPVRLEFIAKRFEEMADKLPEKTKISAYSCRDSIQALKCVLHRESLVLIGIKKRRWPTRDDGLARRLRHADYNVILVETE
jgi:hypothetical protein